MVGGSMSSSNEVEKLLGYEEVSELLGIPVNTLRVWRWQQRGPQSFKVGKLVKFRPSAVQRWIEKQEKATT
jgi:excisionase family DNA binding protein